MYYLYIYSTLRSSCSVLIKTLKKYLEVNICCKIHLSMNHFDHVLMSYCFVCVQYAYDVPT